MGLRQIVSIIVVLWTSVTGSIVDILTISPSDFRGGNIWTMVQGINTALQGVAYGLAVLFFFMGVIKVSGDFVSMKRPEVTVKIFIRLVLTRAAIMYSGDLMLYIVTFVQGLTSMLSVSDISSTTVMSDEVLDALDDMGFIEQIVPLLISLIAFAVITAEAIYLLLKVYNRFFKIFIYTAIAPIPLSFFGGETTSNTGKSFLRNYFSACMEGIVIMLACMIFSAYMGSSSFVFDFGDSNVGILISWEVSFILDSTVFVGLVGISDNLASRIFAS